MFADLMKCLPSIKDSISYIFDYYLGIKLNLSNLSFDNNNNLFLQLTNISIEPNRINHNYLKNINIKLTKGLIEKIEIRIGTNTFDIKISKLSVKLMPVVIINQNENKEEKEIKKAIEEKEKEEKEIIKEENNKSNKKGIISSFIEYYLSKLKISIKEIELIAFNYEIINKNLTYANPVLSFNIYNINYDKGEIEENSYIRKNIWENKHFSIGGICLKISKSFNNKYNSNDGNFNEKEKDVESIDGDNKNNFDKDNNDNILLINSDKGIHFYTNTKNEIFGDIGDIQFVINLFQLELLKNFIDTYSLYLNTNNDNKNTNKSKSNEEKKKKLSIHESQINKNNNISVTNSSSITDKSNNEIMNLKIKLNSFSIILVEKNQNQTDIKIYEFKKDKMNEHFCYFEGNFFIFLLYDFCFEFDNKKKLISLSINDISLNYIEYISKTKKEEEIELIGRTDSEYSECNSSIVFKSNEMFHAMGDNESNLFHVKEYYCSYDYKYSKNQIILIQNINLGYNFSIEDKKKINFELKSLNLNFHPIFLFKILKILYENSFLIKEVLFYNIQQTNKFDEKNKEKENDKNDKKKELISDKENDEENNKKENEDKLELSFLSCEEYEDEDEKKKKNEKKLEKIDNENIKENKIENEKEKENENIIYSSDIIFCKDNDIEPKEKINDKIKNLLKTLNIEIKLKTIEIKVYSFKCEESFYNTINPFFNEFYYDHIYIMDIKDDYRQKKLKINEISSSDYFNIMIKYLEIKNQKSKNGDDITLKFHSIISSFTNNKLFDIQSDTYPIKFNLDSNKVLIDLKINIYFKVKLLSSVVSFINIWKYTFLIFDIFQQRMIYNYKKGKDELEKMNFEDDILKHFEMNKKYKDINLDEENDVIYKDKNDDNKFIVEIDIKAININFDIIPKKIKSITSIKNIKLIYILNNNEQKIEFSINKIESNEFKSHINEIKLDLNLKKIKENNFNININKKISIKSKNSKKNISLNSYIIAPEEYMEDYIQNIIRFRNRRKEIENTNKENDNQNKILTNLNISVKEIELEPLESILYINDIYNVIVKEEIYSNSIINHKNQNILNVTNSRKLSTTSRDSGSSHKKTIIDSILDPKQNENNIESILSKKGPKEPLFIININFTSIKCIIKDETNHRETELNIKDINIKNGNISLKKIEFLIFYDTKDLGDKVTINIGAINDINLYIEEKLNYNTFYQISIEEILFEFCNDSFSYLENILDNVGNKVSKCFVQPKKSNKIVIKQKKGNYMSTYDIDDSCDDRESEIFGNNVAKSVCLISTKNELVLDIDENYLDDLKNQKEEINEIIDDIYKSTLKEKRLQNQNESNLSLTINKINIGLYAGFDFESTIEIKTKSINCNEDEQNQNKEEEKKEIENKNENIKNFNEDLEILEKQLNNNNKDKDNEIKDNLKIDEYNDNIKQIKIKDSDDFEIIEFNSHKKINSRHKDNYLMTVIENLNLSILYEKQNSYEIEFTIQDFEIKDNLQESTFKRLLSARKNIELNEDKKNIPFLSIFVDISNSQNELSRNNYTDFNITCELCLASLQLMIHQNSLLFILNFFIKNEKNKKSETKNDDETLLKLYNTEQYHTEPSYVLDCGFNQIIVEDFGEEQNDLIEDRKFIYITNFLFKEFEIHITYESDGLGFTIQNMYVSLIPDLKDYPFVFNRITYKGFVTISQFTDFFVSHFLGQLSKYNIVFDLLKSLSWTQPIFNIFGDFFDIFISPFQSYRRNQGFMHGLFKGLKKFFFNLLSKNVYAGEKMIRTLTTFIGVTKNNNIGKNSFYEKYILTDEKKKIYDYFYK